MKEENKTIVVRFSDTNETEMVHSSMVPIIFRDINIAFICYELSDCNAQCDVD